ncbi:MAG TPA: hypothetical protein VMT15_08350 [Bryobacteraceae bacterium]|nr:hypothetical protein [Bryobacteraceae bacterium]
MSNMDHSEAEIDNLLRRSLAAPVPSLPPNFKLRRPSERPRRILLASYGLMSAAVSIVVMRGQGLGWGLIAAMTLGPLAIIEAARRLRRKQWEM